MARVNLNSKEKEAEQLLTEKIINKPFDVKKRLSTVVNDIEESLRTKGKD